MKSSRVLSSVRFLGRWTARGAAAACYIGGLWLALTLISYGLLWLARVLGIDLAAVPYSLLGWILAAVMLLAVAGLGLAPQRIQRARQRGCMHSDPRHEFRRTEDGSPTITWLQSELVTTNRKAYRRYWCTRCLQVWTKR
jgi:hypothetical protein